MICIPKQVDVGEYHIPVEKVDAVLNVLDTVRREHDFAITIHRIPDRRYNGICLLVELTKIHLPVDEFHRIISAPICEVCREL